MLTLSCVTTAEDIRRIEDDLLAIAVERGVDSLHKARMLLVLDEILTNVRTHSYPENVGPVRVEVLPQKGEDDLILNLILHDWGPPFNPLLDSPPPALTPDIGERPIGGLGLHLVHNMTCGIRYERAAEPPPSLGRNQLTLSLPLSRLPDSRSGNPSPNSPDSGPQPSP